MCDSRSCRKKEKNEGIEWDEWDEWMLKRETGGEGECPWVSFEFRDFAEEARPLTSGVDALGVDFRRFD